MGWGGGMGRHPAHSSGPPPQPILALQPSDTTYNACGAAVVISYTEEGGGIKQLYEYSNDDLEHDMVIMSVLDVGGWRLVMPASSLSSLLPLSLTESALFVMI